MVWEGLGTDPVATRACWEEATPWPLCKVTGSEGPSLAVQWLRLRAPNTEGTVLVPGWGTKILHAALCGQKQDSNRANASETGCGHWDHLYLTFVC